MNGQAEGQAPKGKSQQHSGKHAAPELETNVAVDSKDVVANEPLPSPQQARRYDPGPVATSRVVPKPVSRTQVEDPREFQIQQLRRRFSPTEKAEDNGTAFTFKMVPSDPDFPFEMVGLECVLHVPLTYPKSGKPFLDVTNKEMGRGYQINVERGFDGLVEHSPQATLLGSMNALDKRLEALLTEQKAETVKIMPNIASVIRDRRHETTTPVPAITKNVSTTITSVRGPEPYSQEQRKIALGRRESETRQLEARLGRLPLFTKSSDGLAYTVPIEPRKRGDLPVPLMVAKSVKIFVPLLYPLQCCRIEILNVARDAAANTENAFERKAKQSPDTTLMGHINYLSQNMHILATEPVTKSFNELSDVPSMASLQAGDAPTQSAAPTVQAEEDRSHIKLIPRPPEWALDGADKEDDESDYSNSYDSGDDFTDEAGEDAIDPIPKSSSTASERGILLSFPFLELYSIELLELISLCITIKCERCKVVMDISNLQNNLKADPSGVRSESCKKCASSLSIG